MVKITNPLGDVKTGKQGEAVYQGKYGQQIRRQAAPKRAMASEAQIAHRQLYRDALTWRKQLSRPNRRYLDGYCIENGVVDSYYFPLPWSRFALKLYLEKVRFVYITKPTLEETEYTGKQEYYDDLVLLAQDNKVYADYWNGQQFTPQIDFELTKVEIYCRRIGNPGNIYLELYALDGEGKPTGAPLASDMKAYGTIGGTFSWIEWNLTHPSLSLGTMYAIAAHTVGGNTSNCLIWKLDTTGAEYPRGDALYSWDDAEAWTVIANRDFGFRIYGKSTEIVKETGLLHVRHPALLAVVQKRGELTINNLTTLSSLDEEYLTGQVGLDVEVGDNIKATTLPGIEYPHPVH